EILLRVSLGDAPDGVIEGAAGVRTRLTLMAVLTRADRAHSRLAALAELGKAILSRGDYAGTVGGLTPVARDPWAAIPVAAVALCLLIKPELARSIAGHAVSAYAIADGARKHPD